MGRVKLPGIDQRLNPFKKTLVISYIFKISHQANPRVRTRPHKAPLKLPVKILTSHRPMPPQLQPTHLREEHSQPLEQHARVPEERTRLLLLRQDTARLRPPRVIPLRHPLATRPNLRLVTQDNQQAFLLAPHQQRFPRALDPLLDQFRLRPSPGRTRKARRTAILGSLRIISASR